MSLELYNAAKEGDLELVRSLLEKGADVNETCASGLTPLHWTSIKDLAIAKLLLENGANINATDSDKNTPLHWLALSPLQHPIELAKLLIENGADVNAIKTDGSTALHWACYYDHTDLAELLLKNGSDVNAVDSHGLTPLYQANYAGHIEIAKLLIDFMLLKNPEERKPDFIKEHNELSAYWEEVNLNSGNSTHRFFKPPNPQATENMISKGNQSLNNPF